ncbi:MULTISPECIES: 23S rRNA (adenine(2030)-N(6))-methyltransferase RlmJ [Pseudoalteromonas]|uniref:Ribosomal RNA large subunit methyltransferase J n=1 Tax=Pseudoalteromonas obscura TaxID=3048491 RepID=A0ABT7EIT3_9GAMM|nr:MULTISPECIES: 23S rRNA (adenine(2030)-N(6))-methyltransferase RlmJ [Pseudoalteromonas]MBQ4838351.1 23S rRNA (adenine(2030)-N(6))-methyltransferase RlmJ [Pseudoalteromonas luteoviolacea]MDK2594958.1 23S rRNA (adenine(2030)-N(6))-methyltransferase RlmJ [Pseudoalteromonas sp. P94(2023)]
MLSYRHSFHAGNPADVIKHLVLAEVLSYMTRKDKPFDYIDTHSGAGLFELASSDAQKTQEFEDGIGRLMHYAGSNEAIIRYLDMVKGFNESALAYYPGSPKVAEQYLRKQDKGWFFELHPQDLPILQKNTAHKRSLRVKGEDGFKGLLGLVPPMSRRAVVLMDPPYEIKTDYQKAVKTILKAHKSFTSGTYMIWYPVVDRARIDQMEAELIASGVKNIQLFELATSADTEERGMTASGMIVINPPYVLKETMDSVLPELVKELAADEGAFRSIELVGE